MALEYLGILPEEQAVAAAEKISGLPAEIGAPETNLEKKKMLGWDKDREMSLNIWALKFRKEHLLTTT